MSITTTAALSALSMRRAQRLRVNNVDGSEQYFEYILDLVGILIKSFS